MNIKVAGIDLAKNIFQVCILLDNGKVQSNRKVSRSQFLHTIRQLPPITLLAMEACGSSHYWGRTFTSMSFHVALLAAQSVKPFVRNQKNDANDAMAICEAAMRPNIHQVDIKTVEQQDMKALRCVRQRLVEQRTAIANQIRGLSAEYGVVFPLGLNTLNQAVLEELENDENGFSHVIRQLISDVLDSLIVLTRDIDTITAKIEELC